MATRAIEKVEEVSNTKANFSIELARLRTRIHSFWEPDGGIPPRKSLQLEVGVSYLPEVKTKTFFLGMSIRVRHTQAPEGEYDLMLHHHTNYAFDVIGIEQLVRGDFVYMPVKWIQRMAEIAYDTSRGFILARSGGSMLEGWVLPLLEEDFIEPNMLKLGVDWSEDDIKIAKEYCIFKIAGDFKDPDLILDENIEKRKRGRTETHKSENQPQ